MRFFRLLLAFTFALHLIFPIVVYAHPGRTDSEGGHYDSNTDEYHYHHGYTEHDHYDMDGDGILDCPYDFDNKTGSSSNESSSSFDVDKFQKELERLDKEKLNALEKELESWKTNANNSSTQPEKSEKVSENTETFFERITDFISYLLKLFLRLIDYFAVWLCLFGVCWIIEKIWKKIKK